MESGFDTRRSDIKVNSAKKNFSRSAYQSSAVHGATILGGTNFNKFPFQNLTNISHYLNYLLNQISISFSFHVHEFIWTNRHNFSARLKKNPYSLLYLEQLRKSNFQLERNDAAKIAYPPARNNIDTREEERASKTISRGQKQAELDRYVP